jgi:predicted NUDIX family NTP pyrophosphohydrolase
MKKSAGILLFRRKKGLMEFFLIHPGGPFWKNKDLGAWSIPKGEFEDEEDPLAAALREFREETGFAIEGNFIELQPVKQKSGKLIFAWAVEKDIDIKEINSNTFSIEWPPKSGKIQHFPEADKGEWFNTPLAKNKINPAQSMLIDELIAILNG